MTNKNEMKKMLSKKNDAMLHPDIEFLSDIDIKNAWKKDKCFFYLQSNKSNVIDKLLKYGITRVTMFDFFGYEWSNWDMDDKLTLAIMPHTSVIDERGIKTIEHLRTVGIDESHIKDMMPIDILTSEHCNHMGVICYFPLKNLIIAKIIPFLNESSFDEFSMSLFDYKGKYKHDIKFRTPEELLELKLFMQWKLNISNKSDRLISSLSSVKKSVEDYKKYYMNKLKDIKILEKEIEFNKKISKDFEGTIIEQIKLVKILPYVKSVKMSDALYVNYGDVYIPGEITMSMKEDKDGVKHPVTKLKSVYIGNITAVLKGNKVIIQNECKFKNDKPSNFHPHPHASHDGICTGDEKLRYESFIGNLNLVELFGFMFSWIGSYNERDKMYPLQAYYDNVVQKKKS